jgi:hypothetical protein
VIRGKSAEYRFAVTTAACSVVWWCGDAGPYDANSGCACDDAANGGNSKRWSRSLVRSESPRNHFAEPERQKPLTALLPVMPRQKAFSIAFSQTEIPLQEKAYTNARKSLGLRMDLCIKNWRDEAM